MNTLPPYLVHDDDLAAYQRRIEHVSDADALVWDTACYAWLTRERDSQHARTAIEGVIASLSGKSQVDHRDSKLTRALSLLTLAELTALDGELSRARLMATQAKRLFEIVGCDIGVGDVHMLYAALAWDRSDLGTRATELERAATLYRNAGDTLREHIAQARLAFNDSYDNPSGTEAKWHAWLDRHGDGSLPPVTALALETRGSFAFSRADYARSVQDYHNAYQTALVTGQIRVATTSLIGVGISMANLGDAGAAIEWLERSLAIARERGWPVLLGQALQQYSMPFITMQRWDTARAMLKESIEVLKPFSPSRRAGFSLAYWGELAHETGDYEEAQNSFRLVQEQAELIDDQDLRISAALGQARALANLGQIEAALEHASVGLEMSRSLSDRGHQIVALRTLANIQRRSVPTANAPATPPQGSIAYLEEALTLAQSIEGFIVDAELYSELAADYAVAQNYEKAYETERRATQVRKHLYNKEVTDRVAALQVRYDTERASARTEHLEAIAQTLQQALETLELLGDIGQEITAKLDPQSVFDTLNRHLGRLMDATHLSIFQMIDSPPSLTMRFGIEQGKPLLPLTIALDDPVSRIARCARERAEIHQDELSPNDLVVPMPGTDLFGSMAFLPLIANERLFGVLSVQAPAPHAYGQRELLVLRTLCAYGAVALSNSTVVEELHQTQAQLVKAMGTLQQLATHDALTGATNRGGFYEQASREISRIREHGMHLSVILFDLDHFKEINDTWGHAVGDEVLQAVVKITDEHSRARDRVARIGGEEFALLLPDVDLPTAAAIAHRLCSSIASTPLPTKRGTLNITASFSVASLSLEDATIDDLLARADSALYEAKHAGRNRVLLAETAT